MKVMKFGGTSVADQPAIERLIALVRAERQAEAQTEGGDARGPVVVVSALSGVTDRLLGVAALAGSGDVEGARTSLQDLRARHVKVSDVITDQSLRQPVVDALNREFDELERVVTALAVLQEVSPRWLDALAATGEILSSQIVAAALTSHKLLATYVDSRKAVVTDAEHTAAAPMFEETTAALMTHADPPLAAGRIPVMGGFVGATTNGVTTTLGRGGSDFSAAIVGACLGASEIQIWTDVDGMLTADPRIVKNPQVVPHLSFAEASELAYFGAKVLHPATIQPAVARNIPVRILNSHRAAARGTLITAERPKGEHPLTAVASKKAVTVVDITSTRMLMAHGFLRRLFEVFERHKTPVDVVTTSEVSVSVTIDDARRLPAIIEGLSGFAHVEREDQMAIVCVVGDGLHDDPGLAAQVLASVGDVPLRMVSQAASRRNITFVIREADLPAALGRVHEKFFAATALRSLRAASAEQAGGRLMRILLLGHGRMGRLVESLAPEYGGTIAGVIDEGSGERAIAEGEFGNVDVAIDFTLADAVLRNLPQLAARRISVVIGTTGWQAKEAEMRAIAKDAGIGVLAAANFSLGVNVFQRAVEEASRHFAKHPEFGAWIHEAHHVTKKDAPSGTALTIRSGMERAGYQRPIDMSSTRAGSIPGTHSVGFDGPSETIEFTHTVRDRAVFARGALTAAKWLVGKQGWFSIRDLL